MTKQLTEELRAFCETTSVRGIPRILKAKTRLTFIVWLLAVLTCTGILIWQLSVIAARYLQYPVITLNFQASSWEKPTFPDITVCNLSPMVFEKKLANLNLTYSEYLKDMGQFGDMLFNITSSKVNYMNLSEDVAFYEFLYRPIAYLVSFPLTYSFTFGEKNSLITDCSYFDWRGNVLSTKCLTIIQAAWNPIYYKCLTLRPGDLVRDKIRGLTAIIFVDDQHQRNISEEFYEEYISTLTSSFATGARVLVHAPGTAPDMSLGMNISPGTESSILLSQPKRTRLARPYSNCTSKERLTGYDANRTYTQDFCVHTCAQQQIVDKCECVSVRVSQYAMKQLRQTNFTVCENITKPTAYSTFRCLRRFEVNMEACYAACFRSCVEFEYDAGLSSLPWPRKSAALGFKLNYDLYQKRFVISKSPYSLVDDLFVAQHFLQLNVQFGSSNFKEEKDVAAFSVDAMWAQIGGVLSLWLGVTVMFLFEIFEFLYNYLVQLYKDD